MNLEQVARKSSAIAYTIVSNVSGLSSWTLIMSYEIELIVGPFVKKPDVCITWND